MRRLLYLLLLAPLVANGQAVCYQASVSTFSQGGCTGGPWTGGTYEDVASAIMSWRSSNCAGGLTYNLGSCSPSGTPTGITSASCSWNATFGGSPFNSGSQTINASVGTCPPPPECEAEIGDGFWTVSASPISGASWCNGLCTMTAGSSSCGGPPGLQTCTSWTAVSALSCEGSTDANGDGVGDDGGPADTPPDGAEPGEDGTGAADPPGTAGESCVDVGDGEYCAAATGDGNCGYVNDTYTCLSRIKNDECKVLGDGSRLCGGGALTTPPVPDNGTPGVLAEPDGQMVRTQPGPTPGIPGAVTNTYNYFSPATVGDSTRDPGTTGASGESTSGSPHAPLPGDSPTGDGDGTGGLGGECTDPDCTAALPTLDDIGTLSEAMGSFWADLQDVPIVAAAAGIAPSFGAGTCPDWTTSVSLYSASIEIDFTSACGLWVSISPVLGAVCLVMFGLLAFRILFSA